MYPNAEMVIYYAAVPKGIAAFFLEENTMTCGIDIVRISRIEQMAERHQASLRRFFTEGELAYSRTRGQQQYASLAGIFAAKEAFFKALGTGFRRGRWTDVEVCHTDLGAPVFRLHGWYAEAAAAGSPAVPALSISHDGDYAVAQVVWQEFGEK